MIFGVILRHYKTYKGLNYIPVIGGGEGELSMYIGDNGVGKSSILESLNTYFNSGYWNRHKDGKRDETLICPFFVILKSSFDSFEFVNAKDRRSASVLSDYFWGLDATDIPSEISNFGEGLKEIRLKYSEDEYYLFGVGISYGDKNNIVYGSQAFSSKVYSYVLSMDLDFDSVSLLAAIRKYYSYVYIPVESKMADILKLETYEMQKLMNKDILDKIDNVLKDKEFDNPFGSAKINAVDYLNKSLNSFMDEINVQVKKINEKYSFRVGEGFKKNLTAFDLREKILEAYFSIRTLKSESKEIFELSSGEQRMALIDIATAFLNSEGEKNGRVILAIDEPEASMHISKCFNQFKRLEKISNSPSVQVMLTTHWYGALPTLNNGYLHHINSGDKPEINSFSFYNYLEKRRDFPEDVELKSYFELVSTILSSIKNQGGNWLICEGSDDKNYFSCYLGGAVENLNIIPVGGCGNVIKIFEYLCAPFNERSEKTLLSTGKILCLIDSDPEQKTTSFKCKNGLKISRLQMTRESNFEFKDLGVNGLYVPTVIEDCLDPLIVYTAISLTLSELNLLNELEVFENFTFIEESRDSRLVGDNSILKPENMDAVQNKHILEKTFKDTAFKTSFAKQYLILHGLGIAPKIPDVFVKTIEYFNNP